jgi:hypothetical protein
MYGLTFLVIRFLGAALEAYARHEHLYSPSEDGGELHSDRRKLLPVVIGYVLAILIGLAVPVAAVVFYFGIAVYAIVPFRKVAGLVFGRSYVASVSGRWQLTSRTVSTKVPLAT